MLSLLVAYDADGQIVATLEIVNQLDADGHYLGTVDFEAHEAAGGQMTDIWVHDTGDPGHPVKGSKTWPEWIGGSAQQFRVELEGPPGKKRIVALVHKDSGHRRERADVEAAIQSRIDEKVAEATVKAEQIRAALPRRDRQGHFLPVPEVVVEPEPADIRDIVGGPGRPLVLDEHGRSLPWVPWDEQKAAIDAARPQLPLIGAKPPEEAVSVAPVGGPLPTP